MKKEKKFFDKNSEIYSVIIIICVIAFSFLLMGTIKAIVGEEDEISDVEISNNKAEEYFYEKDYDKAINEYQKLQVDEEWPSYSVKIAEIYSLEGNVEESNRILEDVVVKRYSLFDTEGREKYEDKDAELCNSIITNFLLNTNYKTALEYGEMFLSEVNDKQLSRTMFTVYMANGLKDKAKKIVETYNIDTASAYDLATLANMEMVIGEWDAGFEFLRKAWYIDKDEIKIFDVIAQVTSENKNEIIKRITKLSNDTPDEICYKVWLAKCYSMYEETAEDASEIIYQLEGQEVGDVIFNTIKAKVYQNLGKNKEAEKIYNKIIKSDDSFVGYHTAAWYYLEMGDYEKALKYCKNSILLKKDYPDNYAFLIPEIMLKLNNSLQAEPYFRTALNKEPFNYNIILKTADFYWNVAKNSEKAYEYFNLASLILPNDEDIFYNMALIKLTEEDNNKAIELVKKCIDIEETTAKYHRTLGTIYLSNGKNEEAIKQIREAYAIDKKDILTLNNAGCYYISVEANLNRALINFKAAYEGITAETDSVTKDIITENYEKIKEISEKYENYDGASITLPNFELFY